MRHTESLRKGPQGELGDTVLEDVLDGAGEELGPAVLVALRPPIDPVICGVQGDGL